MTQNLLISHLMCPSYEQRPVTSNNLFYLDLCVCGLVIEYAMSASLWPKFLLLAVSVLRDNNDVMSMKRKERNKITRKRRDLFETWMMGRKHGESF